MRIMAPRKTTCVPMGKSFLRIAHLFADLRILDIYMQRRARRLADHGDFLEPPSRYVMRRPSSVFLTKHQSLYSRHACMCFVPEQQMLCVMEYGKPK